MNRRIRPADLSDAMVASIHPSAVVERGAEISEGVSVGPFCLVGSHVRLGRGVRLLSHVSIAGATTIGAGTVIYPFAALGHPPQDKKFKGEDTRLEIGRNNVIREHVTMHLGTVTGRGMTRVGHGGFFMAGSHVGHDCVVGDDVVFANNATLGGMATIEDGVILGGLSAVHQLGRVGRYAFIGGGAPVTGDVIPYGMVDNHGALHGLNLVGLKRRGVPRETIYQLRALYRELFEGEGVFEQRLAQARDRYGALPEARQVLDFIQESEKRPLCVPRPG
jgi:UDP-N-acetylglucosamine acyltransferase